MFLLFSAPCWDLRYDDRSLTVHVTNFSQRSECIEENAEEHDTRLLSVQLVFARTFEKNPLVVSGVL